MQLFAAFQVGALAPYPEHLRDVGKVERLLERGEHFDMAPVDTPMALLQVLGEAPGSVVPRHGSECLEGLRTVPLDGQEIVGVMLLDDADGGVACRVQRIQGDHLTTDRNYLQQCPYRRQFAVLVVKVEARDRHAGGVLDQRRGLVAHRAVAIGAPYRLPSAASACRWPGSSGAATRAVA